MIKLLKNLINSWKIRYRFIKDPELSNKAMENLLESRGKEAVHPYITRSGTAYNGYVERWVTGSWEGGVAEVPDFDMTDEIDLLLCYQLVPESKRKYYQLKYQLDNFELVGDTWTSRS